MKPSKSDIQYTTEDQLRHCETEDLSHPEQVQSLGAIIAIDAESTHIRRWSSNVTQLLGVDEIKEGQPLQQVLPQLAPFVASIRNTTQGDFGQNLVGIINVTHSSSDITKALTFELVVHQPLTQPELRIIEFIPLWQNQSEITEAQNSYAMNDLLQAFHQIEASKSLEMVLTNSVQSVQALTQYDRVIIYRFDTDWHGQVIAEATAKNTETRFLGLRFPASDIPSQARALYKINRLRLIADVMSSPVSLISDTHNTRPLDLSHTLLRSPSPFHLSYLTNMGVRSTLTLSILVEGELWGILSCHSGSPKIPSLRLRNSALLMMEMVGGFISSHIVMADRYEASRRTLALTNKLKSLETSQEIDAAETSNTLQKILDELKYHFGASRALMYLPNQIIGGGQSTALTESLRDALAKTNEPVITHKIESVSELIKELVSEDVGGVVLYPFASFPGCGIVLTRHSLKSTRRWGGQPNTFGQYTKNDGSVVLGARRSFEVWQETVSGQCQPWPAETEKALSEAASLIAKLLYKIEAEKALVQTRLLTKAIDVMQDFMLVISAKRDPANQKRVILYANPALCKHTGYTEEELQGQSPDILYGKNTDQAEITRLSDAMNKGMRVESQLINYTRSGDPYHIATKVSPVMDDQGCVTHFVSIQRDMTKYLALEGTIRQTNEKLLELTDKIPGAIYSFQRSPKGDYSFVFASSGYSKTLGLNPKEPITLEATFKAMEPEDVELAIRSIEKSAQDMRILDYIYRVKPDAQGVQRFLKEYAQPYKREDGTIQWFGITKDVTERRNLSIQVIKNEQALQATLNTIPEVLIDLDAKKNINQVYSATDTLFNKSLADFRGQSFRGEIPVKAFDSLFTSLQINRTGEAQFSISTETSDTHYLARIAAKPADNNRQAGYVCSLTDITDRIAEQRKIEYETTHDTLTGLLNRSGLLHSLNKVKISSFTALFIDLDEFKVANEIYGHDTGDALLVEISRRIVSAVCQDALISRIGGDEFLIVLISDINDKLPREKALLIAEHLKIVISKPFKFSGLQHHIDCSIGIANSDDAIDIKKDLMICADIALHSAKQSGGGNIRVFERSMHQITQYRHQLLQALTNSLRQNGKGLKLAYQPVVLGSKIIGYEALLRWHHIELGWVLPGDFIPIIEQSSLIVDLGDWVIQQAMCKLQTWAKDPACCNWVIAVNISAAQIQQSDFVSKTITSAEKYGIAPHKLKLEITETLAQYDLEESIAKLNQLRKIGMQCSLDDFGTGYSSLSHLQKMPLDEIKIDKKFVRDMAFDSGALAITRLIINLAQTLNLRVVAEGVETLEELNMLKAMGCKYFQGYYFGKPAFDPVQKTNDEREH